MTESPTTSGAQSHTSCSTVCRTADCARTRSAMATSWCASRLPASEASAPLGIRMATVGVCSNESGIDSNRTRTAERYTENWYGGCSRIGRQGSRLLEEETDAAEVCDSDIGGEPGHAGRVFGVRYGPHHGSARTDRHRPTSEGF